MSAPRSPSSSCTRSSPAPSSEDRRTPSTSTSSRSHSRSCSRSRSSSSIDRRDDGDRHQQRHAYRASGTKRSRSGSVGHDRRDAYSPPQSGAAASVLGHRPAIRGDGGQQQQQQQQHRGGVLGPSSGRSPSERIRDRNRDRNRDRDRDSGRSYRHHDDRHHQSSSAAAHMGGSGSGAPPVVPVPASAPRVQVPTIPVEVSAFLDTVAAHVAVGGPLLEEELRFKEKTNPYFSFLFAPWQDPMALYYRWRLYSLLQGDSLTAWRTEPFQMQEGPDRLVWLPPPVPVSGAAAVRVPPHSYLSEALQYMAMPPEQLREAAVEQRLARLDAHLRTVVEGGERDMAMLLDSGASTASSSQAGPATRSGTTSSGNSGSEWAVVQSGWLEASAEERLRLAALAPSRCPPAATGSGDHSSNSGVSLAAAAEAEDWVAATLLPFQYPRVDRSDASSWMSRHVVDVERCFYACLRAADRLQLRRMLDAGSRARTVAATVLLRRVRYHQSILSVGGATGNHTSSTLGDLFTLFPSHTTRSTTSTTAAPTSTDIAAAATSTKTPAQELYEGTLSAYAWLLVTDTPAPSPPLQAPGVVDTDRLLRLHRDRERFHKGILQPALLHRRHVGGMMVAILQHHRAAYDVAAVLLDEATRWSHLPTDLIEILLSCAVHAFAGGAVGAGDRLLAVAERLVSLHVYAMLMLIYVINDVMTNAGRGTIVDLADVAPTSASRSAAEQQSTSAGNVTNGSGGGVLAAPPPSAATTNQVSMFTTSPRLVTRALELILPHVAEAVQQLAIAVAHTTASLERVRRKAHYGDLHTEESPAAGTIAHDTLEIHAARRDAATTATTANASVCSPTNIGAPLLPQQQTTTATGGAATVTPHALTRDTATVVLSTSRALRPSWAPLKPEMRKDPIENGTNASSAAAAADGSAASTAAAFMLVEGDVNAACAVGVMDRLRECVDAWHVQGYLSGRRHLQTAQSYPFLGA